jgi:hypothetical protein
MAPVAVQATPACTALFIIPGIHALIHGMNMFLSAAVHAFMKLILLKSVFAMLVLLAVPGIAMTAIG